MYIENIFVLIAAPLVACLFCVRGRPRAITASLLTGMCACLLSAYVSSFAAQVAGIDSVQAAIQVAPAAEEALKLLPLLFFLLVAEPKVENVGLAFVFVAVGFATMESAFYLGDVGVADPGMLALRGFSTAMMHLVCGVIMGYGLTRAWGRPWLRAAGTFGLLCLVMSYHSLFNLLVAAGGYAFIAAAALPIASLALILLVKRRSPSSM
jgi:RsiW-degrading membrane proteinase PrsW (M82 family)